MNVGAGKYDKPAGGRPRRRGIRTFRAKDSVGLLESGTMSSAVYDPADKDELIGDPAVSRLMAAGAHDEVLFRGTGADGFSLVRAWFGPHYVLPRHTHDGDCLYYVIEGSAILGAQTLRAGDGFFVPSDAPYAYEAGPDGVVVLEFRTRTTFGMNIVRGQGGRLRERHRIAIEHGTVWSELRQKMAEDS